VVFLILAIVKLLIILALLEWLRTTPSGKLHPMAAILSLGDRMLKSRDDKRDVATRREALSTKGHMVAGRARPMAAVWDEELAGPAGPVAVRVYRPREAAGLRACLYFHGGGYVVGDLESGDPLARALAERLDAVVVSVDYRLAPEHPFPGALEDAYAALEWLDGEAERLGADSRRIILTGDSAGGGLAASLALAAKERRGPQIAGLVLFYPWVDLTEDDSVSMSDFATGLVLTADDLRWFRAQYAPNADVAHDPGASPALSSRLNTFPAAAIYACEFDVLRDQVIGFAETLSGAGVTTELRLIPGHIHGLFSMNGVFPRTINRELRHAAAFLDAIEAGAL
jgi:acetyl esterase